MIIQISYDIDLIDFVLFQAINRLSNIDSIVGEA